MIFWGVVLTIPATFAVVLYARVMGPRIEAMIERDTGETFTNKEAFAQFKEEAAAREKDLPPLWLSMMPILVPIVLIFINTVVAGIVTASGDRGMAAHPLVQVSAFIGNPVIAVGIGVIIAVYGLAGKLSREGSIAEMEKGVEAAGIIMLVTGAGGALGAVLRDSGTGTYIGQWVSTLPLPAVLIPFVIATLVRLIQGSGTVAMITAASISAPILAQIPGVNMVFAAQAAAIGSMVFGYFNDSYFWVINRILGVKSAKHQMLVWSIPTTIAWATCLVTLLIANAIFG
ncbi:GntP family permease [Roseococcus sp.]|uniref:GntP family permease n=1 Tax=Roseococcus sp. TaxID=2109646 RepID=UPI003BAD8D10